MAFNLELSPGGNPAGFLTPVTLRVHYDPLHVEIVEINELAIYVWDEGPGWMQLRPAARHQPIPTTWNRTLLKWISAAQVNSS